MKKLYKLRLIILLLLSPLCLRAQNTPKTILGSFIYKDKVYNYDFTQQNPNSNRLDISGFPSTAQASQAKDTSSSPASTSTTTPAAGNTTPATPAATDSSQAQKDAAVIQKAAITTGTSTDTATQKPYIFSEFSQKIFQAKFVTEMKEKFQANENDEELKNQGVALFATIQANIKFQDDEPVTAYFRLKSDQVVSILKANASPYYRAALSQVTVKNKIDHVDIETQDGAIKNIQVFLVYDPKATKDKQADPTRGPIFKNQFPISISSKFDPDRFADVNLYSFNCNGVTGLTRYIKLSDVLEMRLVLQNNKEDYSPSERVVSLSLTQPTVELKKEKRSRIIEINAFTDFVGLDQEQPNGLIQIEAKRKINLFTHSWPFFKVNDGKDIALKYNLSDYKITTGRSNDGKITNYTLEPKDSIKKNSYTGENDTLRTIHQSVKNGHLTSAYLSIFTYIEPRLLFSKLDGNNRNYLLDSATFAGKKLVPIKNYQYQLASFGFNLNLVKFSFPDLKFSWNVVDAGAYWYRSRVQAAADTDSKHSTPLNNGILNLSTRIDFHTDSRWGAGFMFGYIWQHLWNNDYKLPVQAGLLQAGFDAFMVTNDADASKLFFRFRWTGDSHHFSNNFTQIQLGYSMNIFAGSNQANK